MKLMPTVLKNLPRPASACPKCDKEAHKVSPPGQRPLYRCAGCRFSF